MEGSVDLARAVAAEGTGVLAATPHCREDHPAVRPRELGERCAILNDRLAADSVDVTVVPAGEVDLLWAQSASDEDLRLVSYCQRGRDLLVETPYGPLAGTFEELLFRLAVRGYRLTLAHPERNPSFQQAPERLAALVHRGVLVQLTAMSLAFTRRRSRSRRLALAMLEEGFAHVIASDAHALSLRPPALADGVAAAARVVGARAEWMVTDAPEAILAGAPLPPAPAASRSPLARFAGRVGRRRGASAAP